MLKPREGHKLRLEASQRYVVFHEQTAASSALALEKRHWVALAGRRLLSMPKRRLRRPQRHRSPALPRRATVRRAGVHGCPRSPTGSRSRRALPPRPSAPHLHSVEKVALRRPQRHRSPCRRALPPHPSGPRLSAPTQASSQEAQAELRPP